VNATVTATGLNVTAPVLNWNDGNDVVVWE
jgi:hypothetical protein